MVKLRKKPAKRKKGKAGTTALAVQQREDKFVEAFITNGGNIKQAAISAGYKESSADRQGSRLMKKVHVSDKIATRQAELAKKYELNTDVIIRSIAQELFFDPANLYNEDGSLKQITELDEDTRMALQSVEFSQVGENVTVTKVKWASRHNAREQAMKHLGMFGADNAQKGMFAGLPRELVKAIVERLEQLQAQRKQITIAP